eukprot:2119123-Pleurochrysis_carterae.AAC.1
MSCILDTLKTTHSSTYADPCEEVRIPTGAAQPVRIDMSVPASPCAGHAVGVHAAAGRAPISPACRVAQPPSPPPSPQRPAAVARTQTSTFLASTGRRQVPAESKYYS